MPFYDLRCCDCGGEHKISATIAEKSEKQIPCPNCGSFNLETVFKSAPAFIKGKGIPECPNRQICGGACQL